MELRALQAHALFVIFQVDEKPSNFEDCVAWARRFWQVYFHNDIAHLLHNFPPDQTTSSGQLFWSGPKKCPKPLIFDPQCDLHMDFVVAAANLRASIYGIEGTRDVQAVRDIIAGVKVVPFAPRENVRIAANDAEAEAQVMKFF